MTRIAFALFVASALTSTAASAQFENHSVSLSAGYVSMDEGTGSSHGVPIGLGYTGYIESGFEWTVNLEAIFVRTRVTERNVFGLAGGPGIRYLFLQEAVRPFVGAELSYLHLFANDESSSYLGVGPKVGLDFFVTAQFSLGVNGQFKVYGTFRDRVETQTALSASVLGRAWF
jgi:outer membrane protein